MNKKIVKYKNEIEFYPKEKSSVVLALHLAQETFRFIPVDVIEIISEVFLVDENYVYKKIQQYSVFTLEKAAIHSLKICNGNNCNIRKSKEVTKQIIDLVNLNDQYNNKLFEITYTECLGRCEEAPVFVLDGEYLNEKKIVAEMKKLIKKYVD